MGTERKIRLLILVVASLFAYGLWNVFTPDAFPLNFVRGEVRKAREDVIIGPYPTRAEIEVLRKKGVKEVVCLMDPLSAVEAGLVSEEKAAVAEAGLAFSNFPMDFNDVESAANKETVLKVVAYLEQHPGVKRYVHCYLGRHRAGMVESALKQKKTS